MGMVPPKFLTYLIGIGDEDGFATFHSSIRAYNSTFSFTSLCGKVDHAINKEREPYVFHINGQNHIGLGRYFQMMVKSRHLLNCIFMKPIMKLVTILGL